MGATPWIWRNSDTVQDRVASNKKLTLSICAFWENLSKPNVPKIAQVTVNPPIHLGTHVYQWQSDIVSKMKGPDVIMFTYSST